MERFSEYCFFPIQNGRQRYTIGDGYGTETFCWFLYSVIRMEAPQTVIEIGSGSGISTIAGALALAHNERGTLWSIDNGSDWERLRPKCQQALGYHDESETYPAFRERLVCHFGVREWVRMISGTAGNGMYFSPVEPVDLVFVDAGNTKAQGCLQIMRYYLPRMSRYSSIFIDGASTIWDAFLFLQRLVMLLNQQRMPKSLTCGLGAPERRRLDDLVSTSSFTVVHLIDRSPNKVNLGQSGRCWLQIRPHDLVADDSVRIKTFND